MSSTCGKLNISHKAWTAGVVFTIKSLLYSLEVPPIAISVNLGNPPQLGTASGLLGFGLLVSNSLGSVLEDVHLPGLTGLRGTPKSGVMIQYMPHDPNVLGLQSAVTSMHTGKIGLLVDL